MSVWDSHTTARYVELCCNKNACFVAREHARPIVTVFEACVALQHSEDGDAWMADRPYSIEFEAVLKAKPMTR